MCILSLLGASEIASARSILRSFPPPALPGLQRSYYPVRLPPMPPPEATLRPLPSHQRVSPDYPNHLSNVPCPLPRRIERVRMSIASPHHAAFPKWQEGGHPHCHFRDAMGRSG